MNIAIKNSYWINFYLLIKNNLTKEHFFIDQIKKTSETFYAASISSQHKLANRSIYKKRSIVVQ